MPAHLHILLLAAGASSRMRGRDKLMEEVQGRALLRHLAIQALSTGLAVAVTLPPDRPLRGAVLDGLTLIRIPVADAHDGLSASLRAGLAVIAPEHSVMVLLADLPELDAADLASMARAQARHPAAILRGAAQDGTPGHPVIFPPWARAELAALSGDEGAKPVLKAHAAQVRLVPLPYFHATTDLDTPEDWAGWRERQARR